MTGHPQCCPQKREAQTQHGRSIPAALPQPSDTGVQGSPHRRWYRFLWVGGGAPAGTAAPALTPNPAPRPPPLLRAAPPPPSLPPGPRPGARRAPSQSLASARPPRLPACSPLNNSPSLVAHSPPDCSAPASPSRPLAWSDERSGFPARDSAELPPSAAPLNGCGAPVPGPHATSVRMKDEATVGIPRSEASPPWPLTGTTGPPASQSPSTLTVPPRTWSGPAARGWAPPARCLRGEAAQARRLGPPTLSARRGLLPP